MKLLLSLLSLILMSCSTIDKPVKTKLLNEDSQGIFVTSHSSFGPPQLSKQLIGNKWWQWDDPQNHQPVTYNVKVVVYKDIPLELVKTSFPVIPEIKQDFRYVSYTDARIYFDEKFAFFQSEMEQYNTPEQIGEICSFPLSIYETALAMERKL